MKIGDYVRLNNDVYFVEVINRIAEIYEDKGTLLTENDGSEYQGEYSIESVIKSSPNIIDLIEVGDYVNGMKITNIWKNDEIKDIEIEFNKKESYLYVKNWNYESRIEKFKIKSILTKEQFKSMEYKL